MTEPSILYLSEAKVPVTRSVTPDLVRGRLLRKASGLKTGRFFIFRAKKLTFVQATSDSQILSVELVYIKGMKNVLNIGSMESKIDNERTLPSKRTVLIHCAVIPFILFWTGISSPIWTDNFIVYALALAPYYFHSFYVSNDWIDGKKLFDTKNGEYASKIWILNIAAAAFSCLFLALLFWNRPESYLYGSSWMALINVGPHFAWTFWALFLHRTRYSRWPILFAPPAGND